MLHALKIVEDDKSTKFRSEGLALNNFVISKANKDGCRMCCKYLICYSPINGKNSLKERCITHQL